MHVVLSMFRPDTLWVLSPEIVVRISNPQERKQNNYGTISGMSVHNYVCMHTCLYMFYTQLFTCFIIQQGQKIVVLFAWMKTWKKISCFPVIVGENLVLYIQVVFRNW